MNSFYYVLGDWPVGQKRPGGGFVLALLGAPRACGDEAILVTAVEKYHKLPLHDHESRLEPLQNNTLLTNLQR